MSELKSDGLEEYNPFGDPRLQVAGLTVKPAMLPLSDSSQPPPYLLSEGGNEPALMPSVPPVGNAAALTVADLHRRQAELDARAAQLDLRERQSQQQGAWRAEHGYGNIEDKGERLPILNVKPKETDPPALAAGSASEVPNWPPLPRCCCCKPCVRIDFVGDIPAQVRGLARSIHYFWLAYSFVLILNVVAALSFFVVSSRSDAGPLFGVSILVAAVLPPAAFFCWNRPFYKAVKNNSSFSFCVFFPFFGAQLVIILIQVLGIDYLGACGWINSLKTLAEHKGVAGFMIVVAILYSIVAAAAIYLLIRAHSYYRGSGASAGKAKQEIAREVMTSSLP